MYAFDVPGYLQGFRFSDDAAFYDADALRFIDQAGYDHRGNGLQITAGTPAFVDDASGQRGLTLDNTVQGSFLFPIPWEGCCVAVMKPNMGANGTIYPVIIGGATTVTSNGVLRLKRNTSASFDHAMVSFSGALSATVNSAAQDIRVSALAMQQSTRKGYASQTGVTITETGPVAAAVNGNGCAPGMAVNPYVAGFKARFGNLSGTIGDTVATANTMTMFELHYFRGNPLVDSPDEMQAFLAKLRSDYGVS